ncbi:MAG: rhomboid family intramembrane serine protease [Hyphomicrobiales bacterium]
MFVPLKDDNPLYVIRFQYVTLALVIANVLAFLVTGPLAGDAAAAFTMGFGMTPSDLLNHGAQPSAGWHPVAAPVTLVTYQFLHAGWFHLLGNMAFLWVFADNVEDAYGPLNFAIFYLLCGVVAGLAHALMGPSSVAPLIGASGAVAGVLGAYLVLYPRARVWILLFFPIPLKIPSLIVLGGWIALQLVSLSVMADTDQPVAFGAHIGGFAAGVAITLLLRKWLRIRRPTPATGQT